MRRCLHQSSSRCQRQCARVRVSTRLPTRAGRAAAAVASALLLTLAASPAMAADPDELADQGSRDDGPTYSVERFEVRYRDPHPEHPSLGDVLPLEVELQSTPAGYVAPGAGETGQPVIIDQTDRPARSFRASAIGTVSKALLTALHKLGLLGIYVTPDPDQIDVESEQDLRQSDDLLLRFLVWTGRIKEVRTVASGGRIKDDWAVDNELHREIRRQSPLQPADTGANS